VTLAPVPKVALLGCGYWGRNLARVLAGLKALQAIHDSDATVASAIAGQHGVHVSQLEEILGDPAIEGIVIATPAVTHGELALRALAADKHVYVEKPLALDLDQAESVVAEARRRDRVLFVGHLLQYHPAFIALREQVRAGKLGRLRYIYSNRLNFGKLRHEESVLWSFAPHDISMILSLAGSEPVKVSTTGSSYLNERIADVTTTHLSFDGNVNAHIFVSWLHPDKQQNLVVVGETAMAVFNDVEPWPRKLMIYPHRVEQEGGPPVAVKAAGQAVPLSPAEPLQLECQAFLKAIRREIMHPTDGAEGLSVLRVLRAADRSLAEGRPIMTTELKADAKLGAMIHPTAVVDQPATIGEGTKVWHFIGQNACIGPDVTIGDDCKIQNNVSIYKGVTLEDGVFCGPSCVFTNVTTPRARVDRREDFSPTLVRANASIGANATIVCGHTIGPCALVAAGAVVTADVPPHALVAGVPARRIGWVSHAGERLGADLVCPREGRRYREVDASTLVEILDE
jgi:predicted dehydrogenase/acetyltransferase-like isoleucine patch superfamily enzyme